MPYLKNKAKSASSFDLVAKSENSDAFGGREERVADRAA